MNWEQIRQARDDLTDYVVHFTRFHFSPNCNHPKGLLESILRCGYIRPSFAMLGNRFSRTPQPTIKGPDSAVCLTEQPISAILKTPHSRYAHYGVAFHKACLYEAGGRPVLYGGDSEIGRRLQSHEAGYQAGKDIYTGGLPEELQYLFVRYNPIIPGRGALYPVDFTWEREWRFKGDLPILLGQDWSRPPLITIIVQWDQDIPDVVRILSEVAALGNAWGHYISRIISFETAGTMLKLGDVRYARLETWPWP
jgi:hypothetical protein